ncbi:arylalkylamine N-acetyltransferase [Danaus plexippus plexippus]|uniref:Arylalkylamine N-acetyltransferase n=1 Tax=Danaus plexippus plexippus TaxID=278856 RepID=A0A212EIJ1_DANPL|nr:arylalkylamine N-acetyltransferase [Danaus plexippus plexippus]
MKAGEAIALYLLHRMITSDFPRLGYSKSARVTKRYMTFWLYNNSRRLADELPAQLSELNLRPRKMAIPYTLRRLTPKDKDGVIEFMRR